METARSTTVAWSVVGAVDDGWRYVADEEKSEERAKEERERGGVVQFRVGIGRTRSFSTGVSGWPPFGVWLSTYWGYFMHALILF